MTFPEGAKKPMLALGLGSLIGLGYTIYRDKKNPRVDGDESLTPQSAGQSPPAGAPFRLTGGFAGTGMNSNVAPPSPTQGPPPPVVAGPPPAVVAGPPPPAVVVPPAPQSGRADGVNGGVFDVWDTTGDYYPPDPSTNYDPPMSDTTGGGVS